MRQPQLTQILDSHKKLIVQNLVKGWAGLLSFYRAVKAAVKFISTSKLLPSA
jgi:hypothetical protein